jgi:hypothetical protein
VAIIEVEVAEDVDVEESASWLALTTNVGELAIVPVA